MERLTERSENGTAVYCHPTPKPEGWKENRHAVLERCCQYEDTGLTPEEIVEYTGWRFTSQELPLSPTEEQIDRCLNEYIVQIEGAALATTLYYYGENIWSDEYGESYAVVAWMPLPKVSNQ